MACTDFWFRKCTTQNRSGILLSAGLYQTLCKIESVATATLNCNYSSNRGYIHSHFHNRKFQQKMSWITTAADFFTSYSYSIHTCAWVIKNHIWSPEYKIWWILSRVFIKKYLAFIIFGEILIKKIFIIAFFL